MQLKVLRKPEYISPSAFAEWRRCQHMFYLKRMAGEYVEEPSSIAAGIGTAVDAMICNAVANEMGLGNDPEFSLEKMLKEGLQDNIRGTCVPRAENIFSTYKALGCLSRLLERGIGAIHPYTKRPLEVGNKTVPVYVKPDLFKANGSPIEIKVQGADSKWGASPHAGYKVAYFNTGAVKYSHDKYGVSLDNLNQDWAYQLTIYSMAYTSPYPFRKLDFEIEHIAVRKETIACSYIPTWISAEFMERVYNELFAAWKNIEIGQIGVAMPSKEKCYAFNQRCFHADRCERYQEVYNDPERRATMLGL